MRRLPFAFASSVGVMSSLPIFRNFASCSATKSLAHCSLSSQMGTKGQNQGRPQYMHASMRLGIGIVNELVHLGHRIITRIIFGPFAAGAFTSSGAAGDLADVTFPFEGIAHFGGFPFPFFFFAILIL